MKIMKWILPQPGFWNYWVQCRVSQPPTPIGDIVRMQGKLRVFALLSCGPHLPYKTARRDQWYNSAFSVSTFGWMSTTRKNQVITLLQIPTLQNQWGLSNPFSWTQFLLPFFPTFPNLYHPPPDPYTLNRASAPLNHQEHKDYKIYSSVYSLLPLSTNLNSPISILIFVLSFTENEMSFHLIKQSLHHYLVLPLLGPCPVNVVLLFPLNSICYSLLIVPFFGL